MYIKNGNLQYLDKIPAKDKIVLSVLRDQILQIETTLEERLSRGVPFFYYRGKRAVGFRSSKRHLSFFIMEGNVLHKLREELSNYNTSSTVIKFTDEEPLPKSLIENLVLARITEISERNP